MAWRPAQVRSADGDSPRRSSRTSRDQQGGRTHSLFVGFDQPVAAQRAEIRPERSTALREAATLAELLATEALTPCLDEQVEHLRLAGLQLALPQRDDFLRRLRPLLV